MFFKMYTLHISFIWTFGKSCQTFLPSWLVLMTAQPRPPEPLVTHIPPLLTPNPSCSSTAHSPPSSPALGSSALGVVHPARVLSTRSSHTVTRSSCLPRAHSAAPGPLGVPRPISLQGSHSCPCALVLRVPTHPWWGPWRGLPCSLGLRAPSLLWPTDTCGSWDLCAVSAALLPKTLSPVPGGVRALPPVL